MGFNGLNLSISESIETLRLPKFTVMNKQAPTTQGQICKVIDPSPDENPAEAYLITEDVSSYADNAIIYVVSITDLQRNVRNPSLTPRKAVAKSELTVIANDLVAYVESWNNQ